MGWGTAVLDAAGKRLGQGIKSTAKSVGKETVGRAAGLIEKAVIEIEDARIKEVQVVETASGSKKHTIKATGEIFEFKDKATSGRNMLDLITEAKMNKSIRDLNVTKKRYTVRFNPNTLTLNAYGGGRVAKNTFDGTQNLAQYQAMDATIIFSVQLIFDDMSPEDCFMNEITDPKGILKRGAKAATSLGNLATDKIKSVRNSVQKQVEGFTAALRSPYTRRVKFCWGNLSYEGILTHVDSEYTMFSIHGRPVRAVMNLTITCADQTISEESMGIWKKRFDEAFSNSDKSRLESAGQNVGNLMNINL